MLNINANFPHILNHCSHKPVWANELWSAGAGTCEETDDVMAFPLCKVKETNKLFPVELLGLLTIMWTTATSCAHEEKYMSKKFVFFKLPSGKNVSSH